MILDMYVNKLLGSNLKLTVLRYNQNGGALSSPPVSARSLSGLEGIYKSEFKRFTVIFHNLGHTLDYLFPSKYVSLNGKPVANNMPSVIYAFFSSVSCGISSRINQC